MTTPLLSVLIDTHNHERYIEQSVVSAIEQDFPASNYEIVVVDDGSTDRTPEIVRKFAPRVRLLRKKNGGQASAFNAAIPELRGEIVAFLDGDDWFAPRKLTGVMNAFEAHPEAAGVGHGYYDFNEETQETKPCTPERQKFLALITPEAARQAGASWKFILMGALTTRRKTLERILPVPEDLVFCADTPVSWGSVAGGVLVLEDPLFYYRHHSDNLFAPDKVKLLQARRRYEMIEAAYESTEPLLLRLGVRADAARALLYPTLVDFSRLNLQTFGGSRLKTFQTEMRGFHLDNPNPTLSYRLFKYLVVGTTSLLLPPRKFYKMQDWYGHRNLVRVREQFVKSQ